MAFGLIYLQTGDHCAPAATLELIIFPPFRKNMQTRRTSRRKNTPNVRAMMDYFMASLMVFFGVFIIYSEKILGYDYFEGSSFVTGKMKWVIGALFMLYGVFKAYRGYVAAKMEKEFDHDDEA